MVRNLAYGVAWVDDQVKEDSTVIGEKGPLFVRTSILEELQTHLTSCVC